MEDDSACWWAVGHLGGEFAWSVFGHPADGHGGLDGVVCEEDFVVGCGVGFFGIEWLCGGG